MKDQKHFTWQDGMPTGPDVCAIEKQFPDLKIGDRIPYEEIEKIIGTEWRKGRFKAVTNSWRKRELERGHVIACEPGKGFVVATSETITAGTYDVLKHISKKSRSHRHKLATIRPESELEKTTVEHHGRLMKTMEQESKRARTNLLPSTNAKGLPHASPPSKS